MIGTQVTESSEKVVEGQSLCSQKTPQTSPPPFRVYICGAHCTGKTTLVNNLAPHLSLHVEEEVARLVARELGWEKSNFHPDTYPDNFEKLNSLILQRQCALDRQHTHSGTGFLADRGVDPIIYMQQYLSRDAVQRLLHQPGIDQWLTSLREDNCLVFIVEPHLECVEEDSVRINACFEDLVTYTSAMMDFLTSFNIPYHVVSMLDRQERVKFVLDVIKRKRPDVVKVV